MNSTTSQMPELVVANFYRYFCNGRCGFFLTIELISTQFGRRQTAEQPVSDHLPSHEFVLPPATGERPGVIWYVRRNLEMDATFVPKLPHGVDTTRFRPEADRSTVWKRLGCEGEYGIGFVRRAMPRDATFEADLRNRIPCNRILFVSEHPPHTNCLLAAGLGRTKASSPNC